MEEILNVGANAETLLASALEDPARRVLAKRLIEALQNGGPSEMIDRARSHRPRIALSR